MAGNPRPKAKKVSPAEKKRKAMNKKPIGKRKANPMAKKKLTNAEAVALIKKEAKARAVKRAEAAHKTLRKKGNKAT